MTDRQGKPGGRSEPGGRKSVHYEPDGRQSVHYEPDGRKSVHYAWIVLGVCFVGLLGAQGVRMSFGAFVVPWENEFQVDRGSIAAVSFVSFIVYGLAQPLIGKLVDRVHIPRLFTFGIILIAVGLVLAAATGSTLTLMLAYGVVASAGFGIAGSVTASVLVARWFVDKRGMAFGILEAGFGAGQLIMAPASIFAVSRFGWRPTLLAYAALLALVLAPLAFVLLVQDPAERAIEPYGGPDLLRDAVDQARDRRLLIRREFWYLIIPFFVCGITTTGMIDTHLIPFAHDHGNSDAITSTAVAVLAFFNIVGTAGSGLLVDRYDPRSMLGALYAVRAVSLVMVLQLNQGYWLVQFGVLFGLVDFATVAPTQTLVSRYFGAKSMGFVFGLILASHQAGSAIGSYVPGLLYDSSGSYNAAFAASAGTLLIASALSFLLPRPGNTINASDIDQDQPPADYPGLSPSPKSTSG